MSTLLTRRGLLGSLLASTAIASLPRALAPAYAATGEVGALQGMRFIVQGNATADRSHFFDMVEMLVRQGVPPMSDGNYACIISPDHWEDLRSEPMPTNVRPIFYGGGRRLGRNASRADRA